MTIRLSLNLEGVLREFAFDRTRVTIGRGPFNDIVLGDARMASVHGTLIVGEDGAMEYDCAANIFPTSVWRDGVCVSTSGGISTATPAGIPADFEDDATTLFVVRVGDILRIGNEPPIDIEILARAAPSVAGWKLLSRPRSEAIKPGSATSELLIHVMREISRAQDVSALLAGTAKMIETMTDQPPSKVTLVILTGPQELHNDVVSFIPAGRLDPEQEHVLLEGRVQTSNDPILAMGASGLALYDDLAQPKHYAVIDGPSVPKQAFLPLHQLSDQEEATLQAVLVIEQTGEGKPGRNFAASMGLVSALMTPLMRMVVDRRAQDERLRGQVEENRYFRERERRHYLFKDLICESEAMRAVYDELNDRVAVDTPVLITGEAGTGKELLARALHHLSWRSKGMLISIACGQMTDEMLGFELFGCVASAWSGAVAPRKGVFELAHDGTVFLDEIDLLSPLMQGKIVRVIKEGEVRRVGDAVGRRINARLVASTHRDLHALVQTGRLRRDLFLALQDHVLEVPPLRQRADDILPLARTFLKSFAQRYGSPSKRFEADLQAWLLAYAWPGNVRELQTFVESAVLKAKGSEVIGLADLGLMNQS